MKSHHNQLQQISNRPTQNNLSALSNHNLHRKQIRNSTFDSVNHILPCSQTIVQNQSSDHSFQFQSRTYNNIVLQIQQSAVVKGKFQFESKYTTCQHFVILTPSCQKSIVKSSDISPKCNKAKKQIKQKENRNIFSNLLRTFFKNIVQTGLFNMSIKSIIQTHKFTFTNEQFYQWLACFNINYKNYVKLKQLLTIISRNINKQKDKITVLLILLKIYLQKDCIGHSLTSKRIVGNGRIAHLRGVRLLKMEVNKVVLCRQQQ